MTEGATANITGRAAMMSIPAEWIMGNIRETTGKTGKGRWKSHNDSGVNTPCQPDDLSG